MDEVLENEGFVREKENRERCGVAQKLAASSRNFETRFKILLWTCNKSERNKQGMKLCKYACKRM